MGKGQPSSGCAIVLVCLDIASEDNSLSAHVLTVTSGKQTGNWIPLKWNLRFWRPQSNPQGDLKSSSSAAVLVINNNNSKDNSFPRLQKLSGTYFSVSWIGSGETDNLQFTSEGPGLWRGWVTWLELRWCVWVHSQKQHRGTSWVCCSPASFAKGSKAWWIHTYLWKAWESKRSITWWAGLGKMEPWILLLALWKFGSVVCEEEKSFHHMVKVGYSLECGTLGPCF